MNKIEQLKQFFSQKGSKSVEDYQKAIQQFGLVCDVSKTIYGDEIKYMLPDRSQLGIYQTPIQFARLLKWLEPKRRSITSYIELGVFQGGTFAFMHHFLPARTRRLAVDSTPQHIHPDIKSLIHPFLAPVSTGDPELITQVQEDPFDLVFIDADHSYEACKADWENIGKHGEICIFHDIVEPTCPGVIRFWNELKNDPPEGWQTIEFTDSIGGNITQGIGVIYR
ncbi:MAG TPA: class I SAM-dependent methyltransferase [Bacteroidales bacterium]|nr:class I SAM-dependent methyltransferase [Bacteroidales bacterium]